MSEVQLARLETQMKAVAETLAKNDEKLDKLTECYQENTTLLAQTCTVLQEFKSVKQEQNTAAVERAKLEKDVSYLKKATTACLVMTLGVVGNASGFLTGEQLKALVKIFGA